MKNYYLLSIVFLLLFSSVMYAEEIKTPNPPSIKTLIEQVKRAEVKDRRLLMNQLKLQLRKMNKESRHSAMMELKKSFSKEHGEKKLHKEQHRHKQKKLHEHRGEHQPMYRHLRNMQERRQGEGEHRREGNGRK